MARSNQRPLFQEITKGILRENPVFRLMLGICPVLAVTTSIRNGLGMGLASTIVLIMANLVISLLRNVIPEKVRIPSFIIIISGFVTIVHMLMQAYFPDLNQALGIFIPLITVNCIILGRAEIFASKRRPLPSILDGLGMGLGYTVALMLIGLVREVFGNGTLMGLSLPLLSSEGAIGPILIMIMPPGGFFAFGILVALAQRLSDKLDPDQKAGTDFCAGATSDQTACLMCGNCALGQKKNDPVGPETARFSKGGDS